MPEDNFQLNTPALPGTVMPFSAEAEQAVLGAVLPEPDCLSTVAEMLPRADYLDVYKRQLPGRRCRFHARRGT